MATSLIAAVGDRGASAKAADRYSYLLLLRFTIVNAVGFMMLAAVWMQGWLAPLLEADGLTHMCKLIFIVFLIGLVRAAREAQRLSFELNQLAVWPESTASRVRSYMDAAKIQDSSARATLSRMLQLRLAQKIAPVRHIASRLVLLGIIGTILGFIIALYGGIDTDAATDVTAVGPMVALVLQGIGVAFFKTLTGSVLNVWLMINYRLLEEGTVHLVTHVTELAEKRGAFA